MRDRELKADIVVSVSGGCVNGIFGPEGARVLLIDFDNVREGDDIGVSTVDGSPGSKACRATIEEALEIIAGREERGGDV